MQTKEKELSHSTCSSHVHARTTVYSYNHLSTCNDMKSMQTVDPFTCNKTTTGEIYKDHAFYIDYVFVLYI